MRISKYVCLFALALALLPGTPFLAKSTKKLPALKALTPIPAAVFPTHALKGTLTHNENFPPLPASLRPGAVFNAKNVPDPKAKEVSRWYRVPAWMSGRYSYGPGVLFYVKDFKTGKETHPNEKKTGVKGGRYRGIFVDKAGNIWQKAYGGSIDLQHEYKTITVARYEDELIGYLISQNEYVEDSAGIDIIIDKGTGRILQVSRYERTRNFSYKNGIVSVTVDEKDYDLEGKPLNIARSRSTMTKREGFIPLKPGENSVAGKYDKALADLRKFMEATGDISNAPDSPNGNTDKSADQTKDGADIPTEPAKDE